MMAAKGIGRSLRLYYHDEDRTRRMQALASLFVGQGDLAFDLGAHVGDRTACFRRLGARVVAVEPQPAAMRALRLIHGRDAGVTLVAAAVGARPGRAVLHLNATNPTVSTLSAEMVFAARDAPGWRQERWDGHVEVDLVTLDTLVAAHGRPDFVKLDIEGFEDAALAGLSTPLPALSVEFTTLRRDVALNAIAHLALLGPYRFNATMGEDHALLMEEWQGPDAIAGWLRALPHAANAGDIYARLE